MDKKNGKRGGRKAAEKFAGNIRLSTFIGEKRVNMVECEADQKGINSLISAAIRKHGNGEFKITVEKVLPTV
jgi:hypothetical protein